MLAIVAPMTDTTEIRPPIKSIRGSWVLRYTKAVKATRAVNPATLMRADLDPGRIGNTYEEKVNKRNIICSPEFGLS